MRLRNTVFLVLFWSRKKKLKRQPGANTPREWIKSKKKDSTVKKIHSYFEPKHFL
jgi:hypothetical protein